MDLDELNDNFQVSLEQLKQSQEESNRAILQELQALKSSTQTSKNSNELTLIFSKLNDFEKKSNENLKNNEDELSRNARSVYGELSSSVNSKLNELKESVKKSQDEMQSQIAMIADGVGKDINKKLAGSVSQVLTASQNLEFKSRKNIFYSAGLTLLLLLVAVGGILFVWKWHDGTKIAEMRIEKMLESERADIQKKAVEDYRNSYQFREDACQEVAENIAKLDTLHYLNKYIKSSTVSEYPALKSFYKDFIKSGDEQYKKSKK